MFTIFYNSLRVKAWQKKYVKLGQEAIIQQEAIRTERAQAGQGREGVGKGRWQGAAKGAVHVVPKCRELAVLGHVRASATARLPSVPCVACKLNGV